MKKLIWRVVLIVFTFLIIIATNSKTLTDQQVHKMIDEGFSKSNNILLHKERVDNGLVVFYGDYEINNTLGARFMKKNCLVGKQPLIEVVEVWEALWTI
jgi:hypothetical protein